MSRARRGSGHHKRKPGRTAHGGHRGRVTDKPPGLGRPVTRHDDLVADGAAGNTWQSVMYGVCADDDALEEAKRQLHDALIARLGAARRGGVTWRIVGAKDAPVTIDRIITTERLAPPDVDDGGAPPDTIVAYLEQCRSRLADWPDGYFIIASCPADRSHRP